MKRNLHLCRLNLRSQTGLAYDAPARQRPVIVEEGTVLCDAGRIWNTAGVGADRRRGRKCKIVPCPPTEWRENRSLRPQRQCGSYRQCKANVVLLDCGYRVWTGISTLRQIKEAYPDVPVIFLSDLGSEDAAIHAFKLGAREYFRKPVNIFELKRTMDRLLSDKQRASDGDGSRFTSPDLEDGASCVKFATSDKPQYILQVISYIEDNLWKPLELEHLAGKAHLSKFHFCRVFKRHIGMNPMKFVTLLRIERAKELLKRNDFTVSLVANEVGFKDLSNFIRQFKKNTGVTPTMYRKHGQNARRYA